MKPPPFLRPYEIADRADEFRRLFVTPPDQIPIDIEHIIENVLHIRIEPLENLSRISRRSDLAIDAYLTTDLSRIVVDKDQYVQGQHRLKFTLAHELGHWYLHKDAYEAIEYDSIKDFIKIQKSLNFKNRNQFEFQANEFAAAFLVPKEALIKHTKKYLPELKSFVKKNGPDQLRFKKYEIAEDLIQTFDVSSEVIKNRIENEEILQSLLGL